MAIATVKVLLTNLKRHDGLWSKTASLKGWSVFVRETNKYPSSGDSPTHTATEWLVLLTLVLAWSRRIDSMHECIIHNLQEWLTRKKEEKYTKNKSDNNCKQAEGSSYVIIMGDGNSSLILPSSDRNQHRNVPSAEHTHDSEDSDDTQSNGDITWSPGDGICPTTVQFNCCCDSKFNEWKKVTSMNPEQYDTLILYTRAFLDLLKDIPPLLSLPSRTHQHYR